MIPGRPQPATGPRRPPLPGTGEIPEPAEAFDAPGPPWFSLKEEVEGLARHVNELKKRIEALEGRLSVLEGTVPTG